MSSRPHAFRIAGLDAARFSHLYGLSDEQLATHHAVRFRVDAHPGFPDRIELRDADIGETVLLVNHAHLPHAGPYASSHAVFVIEGARRPFEAAGTVPTVLRSRMLSVRSFDCDQMMLAADLVDGAALESMIERLFEDPSAAFLHVHYAKRGCFACRVDRVV
ncbi:DUF1203 domain-containing protein [soil metagenome]